MPQIPRYFARERMEPSRMPRAPAWYLSRTGGGVEARAMVEMGGQLGKISAMLSDIEAERQRGRDNATLASLSDQERDFVFGAYGELEKFVPTEIKEFPELEEKFGKEWDRKIKQLIKGQNRQVAEHLSVWAKQNRAKVLQDYHEKIWPKEQSFGQGQAISIAQKYLRRADSHGAIRIYNQHAQYFPSKQLQALKDKAPHDTQWYSAEYLATNRPDVFLENLGKEDFLERLDPSEKQQWKEVAENKIRKLTAAHDPKVYMPLLRKVMKDPDSVTEDEIYNAWGRGLDEKDYKELMKIKETKGHPLKSDRALIRFKQLDALYEAKPPQLTPLEYDIKNEKLKEWFEANPDATAKQAQEYWDELVNDIKTNWLDKILKGLSYVHPLGGIYRGAKYLAEEEEESATREDFEARVRSIQDEDEAKKYYKKWVSKWQ